jgi:ABC-type dipeptide/oligopeptide/nickel transport system permease component
MNIIFVIALIILIVVSIFFFMNVQSFSKKKMDIIREEEVGAENISAMEVMLENLKDPVIVNRIDFTENPIGSIGNFTGYSSIPEDHWLHGFPHEKSQ